MRLFSIVWIGFVGVLTISCSLYHSMTISETNYTMNTSASIEEGKRTTMLMCGSCHYNPDTKNFSGKKMEDAPTFFGKVYASNITQHKKYGIGSYSEAELAYLIRTGVSKSGKIMPYMQRPNIADKDLWAIITFLKSEDATVQASDRVAGKTSYTIIGKLAISTVKPMPYKNMIVNKPLEKGVALGKYLVDNLACFHCHSKSFTKLNMSEPEKSKGFMGGGNRLKDGARQTIRTPNLTPHETGILNWNLIEFKRAITEGISKDNSSITYPMPLYPELTEDEVASMYQYLGTVNPINSKK
jgi:Cytochrome C oxidase, cbb3-type, subunit III